MTRSLQQCNKQDMSAITANYKFSWPAGPKDVILTGNFDDWKGSLPLVPNAKGEFEITFPVKFENDQDKFFFKFIVDGDWTASDSYKKQSDGHGFENNFIEVEDTTSDNSNAGTKIPEAGSLPVTDTREGSTTPSDASTSKAGRAPPSTSNRRKGKKKKVKVKKKIRRNKKTGERTIVSEEVEELDTSNTATPAEDATEEEVEEVEPSKSATPAQTETAAPDAKEDEQFHTLPTDQNKETTQFQDATAVAQSGPGPVLVSNPEEIKEFKEVSEVDADELNERLNKELNEENNNDNVPEPEVKEEVSEGKPVTESTTAATVPTLDPRVNSETEEPSENVEETAKPAEKLQEEAKKETKKSTPSQKEEVPKTKKTVPPATKTEEKPKKKKGFFGKLKKLFN